MRSWLSSWDVPGVLLVAQIVDLHQEELQRPPAGKGGLVGGHQQGVVGQEGQGVVANLAAARQRF